MIYEKFLMSAWIGDQSKLFGTSREPSERNFYVGISWFSDFLIKCSVKTESKNRVKLNSLYQITLSNLNHKNHKNHKK
jgi:hypothetical protein